RGESPTLARQETVEQAFRLILGHVDHAGCRVDRRRFVVEAPERLERLRRDQPDVTRRHLEHVAVVARMAIVGALQAFLATQPRTPWRRPAGAVAQRAAQAHELSLEPAR